MWWFVTWQGIEINCPDIMRFINLLIGKVFDVDFAISASIRRHCNTTTFSKTTYNSSHWHLTTSWHDCAIHIVNNTQRSDVILIPFKKDSFLLTIKSAESWSTVALNFLLNTTSNGLILLDWPGGTKETVVFSTSL